MLILGPWGVVTHLPTPAFQAMDWSLLTRLSASVLVIILVVTHACVHIVVSMSFVPGLSVNAIECI